MLDSIHISFCGNCAQQYLWQKSMIVGITTVNNCTSLIKYDRNKIIINKYFTEEIIKLM